MKIAIVRIKKMCRLKQPFTSAWHPICSAIPCFVSISHNIIETQGAVTFKGADAESSVSLSLHLIWTYSWCLQHSQTSGSIQYKVLGIKPFISAQNYTAGWSVVERFNEQINQIISFHEIDVSLRIFLNTTVFNKTCQSSFLWARGDGHQCLYSFSILETLEHEGDGLTYSTSWWEIKEFTST